MLELVRGGAHACVASARCRFSLIGSRCGGNGVDHGTARRDAAMAKKLEKAEK